MIDSWLAAVCRELSLCRGLFPRFETVYFGGGTPSLLSEKQLGCLMRHVCAHATVADNAECTIEVNPDDLGREKARSLRALGFNRLSIGVQSFDERLLHFLQRRHTARQSRAALAHAAAAGFAKISIDLMYGIPDQDWRAELVQALEFQPGHLSCYQLTIKPGTPFYDQVRSGSLTMPSDERLAELFLFTDFFLAEAGYGHYEVSSFAHSADQESRHNSRYWQHLPYLGLGPSAHSFDGRRRWWNVGSVQHYCCTLDSGDVPVAGEEILSAEQIHLERLMLGMRTSRGVARGDVAAGENRLAQLEREGLLSLQGVRVTPTARGMLFSDRLPLLLEE